MAHGPPGTGNCTQPFEGKLEHDNWARLLYLLPRWLLVKPRGKRQLHAREIRGRVDSFMANEWGILDKTARLAGTTPAKRRNPLPEAGTKGMTQQAIEKNKRELRAKVIKRAVKMIDVGDLGRGARTLGNPQYVITRKNCDEADPTGTLWSTVVAKARALHPDDDNPFDEYTECERNDSKPWGCGGISDEIADIHFAAVMTFLLKPAGDPDEVYTQLMTDWSSMEPGQWSIRPIAVGNAHDRTIGRARLGAVRAPIKKHFQSEEVGQYAFGAERGGEMLIIA